MMTSKSSKVDIKEILYGFCVSQCLYVAASLRIADCLTEGPKTCTCLAEITGSDAGAIRRVLRTLANINVFREESDDSYALTEMSEMMRSDVEGSIHTEVMHMLNPTSWASWGDLLFSVKTGKASFPRIYGEDAWSYRLHHPEVNTVFEAMAEEMSRREELSVLRHMDIPEGSRIVDVGGGKGELIAAILARHPGLSGVLFDSHHIASGAAEILRKAGVEKRCRVESGDFFRGIPKGGDIYILKAVIHNWDDEKAVTILRNCGEAMEYSARIVLVERVLGRSGNAAAGVMDLHMLVIHGGKERTRGEYKSLLEAAGFELDKVVETPSGLSLIEGVPAWRPGR